MIAEDKVRVAKWREPLPAPAKLNLFLHVLGRRADGYHSLQSVVRLINWYDVLTFHPAPAGTVAWLYPVPQLTPDNDLALRAARLLLTATGVVKGATIELKKNLPLGAGLGGGSSDAALTLWALNQLWELNLSNDTLNRLALSLGADVPFFLAGHNAWMEGIGEHLTAVVLPPTWYVVLVPKIEVSTAEIFSSTDLNRHSVPLTHRPQAGANWDAPLDFGHNDLEPVTCALYPEVRACLEVLSPYGPARMSGSGSAVFLPTHQRKDADRVADRLPRHFNPRIVEGLPYHPAMASV